MLFPSLSFPPHLPLSEGLREETWMKFTVGFEVWHANTSWLPKKMFLMNWVWIPTLFLQNRIVCELEVMPLLGGTWAYVRCKVASFLLISPASSKTTDFSITPCSSATWVGLTLQKYWPWTTGDFLWLVTPTRQIITSATVYLDLGSLGVSSDSAFTLWQMLSLLLYSTSLFVEGLPLYRAGLQINSPTNLCL